MSNLFHIKAFCLVERENSQPITGWHIILPSPQCMANYKASCTATSFHYHHSETKRGLPSVIEIKHKKHAKC